MNLNRLQNNLKLGTLLFILTGLFLGVGFFIGGETGMIIALFLAGIMNFGSYWYSHKIVLKMYNAEKITEEENPELHKTLEELSKNAEIPKPQLYKSDMQVPNAFATGRNPEHGIVCLTEGLMQHLDKEEIEGVIAHELAHIKNRDTLINAAVATIAGAVAVIARIAFYSALFTGGRDRGQIIGSLAFMILTPLIAMIIKSAISRKMEYRADTDAVKIHKNKNGLSNALKKISNISEKTQFKTSQVKESGSNLFIYNPFTGDKLTKYFDTHPSLDQRLENIEKTQLN